MEIGELELKLTVDTKEVQELLNSIAQETAATIARKNAELEELRTRGRNALKILHSIKQDDSKEELWEKMREAMRALNSIAPPRMREPDGWVWKRKSDDNPEILNVYKNNSSPLMIPVWIGEHG